MERKKRGIDFLGREICSRQLFLESYSDKARAEKLLVRLDRRGVFPLTYQNPKLAFLNVLGLYTYFSGALTQSKSTFDAMISGGREQQRDLSVIMASELGLTLRENRRSFEFGENGGTYARLLSLMGFFTSRGSRFELQRKASVGTGLPVYLTDVIEQFEKLTLKSKGVCKKFLRDLVSVCFDTKGYTRTRGTSQELLLELLTQPSAELVQRQGLQIIHAMQIVYPAVGIKDSQLSVREIKSGESRQKYEGSIHIPLEQAVLFPNNFNSAGSIEVSVRLRPSRYSFEHTTFNRSVYR
jgi:hypothetical protein